MRRLYLFSLIFATLLLCHPASAQRGTGQRDGVSRQGARPEMVSVHGTIAEVKVGPCEMTTGRAIIGAHVMLETAEGNLLNIHLGPTPELDYLVDALRVGDPVVAEVFRTERLAEDAFVARVVTLNDKSYTLRDRTLRPVWAGR